MGVHSARDLASSICHGGHSRPFVGMRWQGVAHRAGTADKTGMGPLTRLLLGHVRPTGACRVDARARPTVHFQGNDAPAGYRVRPDLNIHTATLTRHVAQGPVESSLPDSGRDCPSWRLISHQPTQSSTTEAKVTKLRTTPRERRGQLPSPPCDPSATAARSTCPARRAMARSRRPVRATRD